MSHFDPVSEKDESSIPYVRRGDVWVPSLSWTLWLRAMIRKWAGTGAASVMILILGALSGLWMARLMLDAQSKRFAEDSMAAISLNWSREALFYRASTALMTSIADDPTAQINGVLAQRPPGKLKYCVGHSSIGVLSPPMGVTATYMCEIGAPGGDITALVTLSKRSDMWKIAALYVDPPKGAAATSPPAASARSTPS